MSTLKLIADSGSTKTEWCLLKNNKPQIFTTQGMSPYFLDAEGIKKILIEEVKPVLKKNEAAEIFFYGTGCKNPANIKMVKKVFLQNFLEVAVTVDNDLSGEYARGHQRSHQSVRLVVDL